MVPSLKWRGGEVYELRFYPAYDDLCLGVNINNLQQKSWYLWYLSWHMVNAAHVSTISRGVHMILNNALCNKAFIFPCGFVN